MKLLSLNEVMQAFPDEKSCMEYLEKIRWNGIVISPFSENAKVYHCRGGKFKCRDSGKYFNAKTNTIFHNSRISLQKWFIAIWIIAIEKDEITSVELAKNLNLTQKTAWYMMQRIRTHFDIKKTKLSREKNKNLAPTKEIEAIEVFLDPDKLKMTAWLSMLKK